MAMNKYFVCVVIVLVVRITAELNPLGSPLGRFLVTGAAGFIGSHVCRRLVQDSRNLVVGIDNFNDYYDVTLKVDRAYDLNQHGVLIHKAELCDEAFLRDLFLTHQFTHVIHLAAQAGVRYSLDHPLTYIRSNVGCQIILMDIVKEFKDIKFIYASSSSVYGKTNPVPFSTNADVDHPGNLYAATKRMNEVLCKHYCQRFHLSEVGLRFFTVYGPWGRPDMAIYKFTEAIVKQTPLPMFSTGDISSPLSRDFTYVDDIISGIMAATHYTPRGCGEAYNLGFGNPVSVPESIRIIERELGMKAVMAELPLPPTEILRTWANITESRQTLGFSPQTDLVDGVRRFVEWYRDYQRRRADETAMSSVLNWYTGLEAAERARQIAKQSSEAYSVVPPCEDLNDPRREKGTCLPHFGEPPTEALRHAYVRARLSILNVTDMKRGLTMRFIKGLLVRGEAYQVVTPVKHDPIGLQRACAADLLCTAITTEGLMMRFVFPEHEWQQLRHASPTRGIYVYDIDHCLFADDHCPFEHPCKIRNSGNPACAGLETSTLSAMEETESTTDGHDR